MKVGIFQKINEMCGTVTRETRVESISVKLCQNMTNFYWISLKNNGFKNPLVKINEFSWTHQTHANNAPGFQVVSNAIIIKVLNFSNSNSFLWSFLLPYIFAKNNINIFFSRWENSCIVVSISTDVELQTLFLIKVTCFLL